MSIEGLKVIMDKKEVLSTVRSQDLLDNARMVEESYLHHVRAYLPMGRASGSGEQQQSVADYEKRLINRVKASTAMSGYISAPYGYGKTSTAAFLWQRCTEARLLCVPPFELSQLSDILTAAYAWGRYELKRTRPLLLDELEQLYRRYAESSLEADAKGSEETVGILRKLQQENRYTLKLTPGQLLGFIDSYTDLALRAGFEGVVILPDELQQYMNPAINSGATDPLSDLFSFVNGLGTRRDHLKAAVIFVMPTKEYGLIRLQRGDITDRLQEGGLTFDLQSIYDADFANRLWQKLAQNFDFAQESDAIVEESTLKALGQIAARDDLGSGPRTVIDGYKAMVSQYLNALEGHIQPRSYTPIDLIDGYLNGAMRYTGDSKLTRVVRDVLHHPQVSGQSRRAQAVKLLAAFPSTGVPLKQAQEYGYADEVNDLIAQQLTIRPGGRDSDGRLTEGYTLRGLEPENRESDWLTTTLSEFIRINFYEKSSLATLTAANGFKALLMQRIFNKDWKLLEETTATESRDASLLVEGSFPPNQQFPKKYPARRVFVHILRDGQSRSVPTVSNADLILEFDLCRYAEMSEEQRRLFAGEAGALDPVSRVRRYHLNLSRHSSDQIFAALQQHLDPILSPARATPLMLLNIYDYLDEKDHYKQLPQTEADVKYQFMPDLLDGAMVELFNAALNKGHSSGKLIIEDAFREAMALIYPNYVTIMGTPNYNKTLVEYITALERLDTPLQRRGEEPYVDNKEEVARLFNRSNTGIDAVISAFPMLLRVDAREWTAKKKGSVYFTLHDWEKQIVRELSARGVADSKGKKRLPLNEVRASGVVEGYRDEEIKTLLALLAARDLAEVQNGDLVQAQSKLLSPAALREELGNYLARVKHLVQAFPDDALLANQQQTVQQRLTELAGTTLNEQLISRLTVDLKARLNSLEHWRRNKHSELFKSLRSVSPLAGLREADLAVARRSYSGPLAEQLEPLRERVLAEAAGVQSALQQSASQFQQLQVLLPKLEEGVEVIAEDKLTEVSRLFQTLHRARTEQNEELVRVGGLLRQWESLSTLMSEAASLQQELASDPEYSSLQAEYEAWLRGIRSRLSISRLEALTETGGWRNSLTSLRQQLGLLKQEHEQQRQVAATEFAQAQAAHQSILREAGIPVPRIFSDIVYNPTNPAASNIQLVEAASNNWLDVINQLANLGRGLAEQVQQIQTALAAETALPNRAALIKRCAELPHYLGEAAQHSANLKQSVADHVYAGPKAVQERVLPTFASVRDALVWAGGEVSTLRSSFSEMRLSTHEAILLEELAKLPAHDGYIDLTSLLQAKGQANEAQTWQDLASLYRKLRLRVKLQVIADE